MISLLFFLFRQRSSVVESNKCIDVSFICRHFGDSRGLIKSELLGTEEMLLLLRSCYKNKLVRETTFIFHLKWRHFHYDRFIINFLTFFIICINSDATATATSEKLQSRVASFSVFSSAGKKNMNL